MTHFYRNIRWRHNTLVFCLLLALSTILSAEIDNRLTTSNVRATGITKSSAIISYNTLHNGATFLSRTKILFGTTASLGYVVDDTWANSALGLNLASHSSNLTGLAADTTYYYCPQVVDPADLSHVSGCAGNQVYLLHTLRADRQSGPAPVLPIVTVDTTMPIVNGGTYAVAADCRDLQDRINSAATQSNHDGLTYQVVIPAGAVCTGAYNAPGKSGKGWVIVRTSTPDSFLPAAGIRITPAQRPLLATIRDDSWFTFNGLVSPGDACLDNEVQEHQGVLSGTPVFDVMVCRQGHWNTVKPIATATGASQNAPATCGAGDWWFNPFEPYAYRRIWYCVQPNNFVNMDFRNDNGNSNAHNFWGPGLNVAAGASHYRFVGLEFTNVPTPGVAVTYSDMNYENLVTVSGYSDHIVFDHVYVHGSGAPSKTNVGLVLDGSNQALVDSYVDDINAWYQLSVNGENNGQGIVIGYGPGPLKVQNNFIGAVGIGLFSANDGSDTNPAYNSPSVNLKAPPSDVEVIGNYFHVDPKYDSGSPASDGYVYTNRNLLEMKYGSRWLIQGNLFDGNFSYTSQGPAIAMTVRPALGSGPDTTSTISDVTVRDNIFKNLPNGLVISGSNDNPGFPEPINTARIQFQNNLFQNIDGNLVSPYIPVLTFTAGTMGILTGGPTDVSFDHNTMYRNRGTFPGDLLLDGFNSPDGTTSQTPGTNFSFTNNVMNITYQDCWGLSAQGDVPGTAALNGVFYTRVPGNPPSWKVQGNGFVSVDNDSGRSCAAVYPSGNNWSSGGPTAFLNPTGGDYSLANSSSFHNTDTDGGDPGVNMSELSVQTANTLTGGAEVNATNPAVDGPLIYNVAASGVTSASAFLTWTTDWTATSHVQYGTSLSYGQDSGETDLATGGCYAYGTGPSDVCSIGVSSHDVGISGLRAGTIYHYAVISRDIYGNVTQSADHTFLTATGLTVSPNSGSGSLQNFTLTFENSIQAPGLETHVLFGRSTASANACHLVYRSSSNSIYLMNDAGTQLLGPVTPQGRSGLSNSQCSVSASNIRVSSSPGYMNLTLLLSFAQSFSGVKTIFGYTANVPAAQLDWQTLGTWTVPAPVPIRKTRP